jgi:putative NADPH-quinone reductase
MSMPAAVKKWGIRVRCIGCEKESRHKEGLGVRLREKRCAVCGMRLRPLRWFAQFPDRAIEEKRQAQFELFERRINRDL